MSQWEALKREMSGEQVWWRIEGMVRYAAHGFEVLAARADGRKVSEKQEIEIADGYRKDLEELATLFFQWRDQALEDVDVSELIQMKREGS